MEKSADKKNFYQDTLLAISALGVVFGDIGTSILYTFQECFHGHHPVEVNAANILGLTSLILWSLFLVVTLKYVWIVMNASNKGEGGILSLLALIPMPIRMSENGRLSLIAMVGIAGAALLLGDGIITPAISVLSAMEGLEYANPELGRWVLPGTVGILIGLFLVQSRGTGKLGGAFGGIVLAWFLVASSLGILHILKRPDVLAALKPYYAFHFFVSHGSESLWVLSSVILAVTGGEALYADMGHFGKRPIRYAWHAIVLPALCLNYLGQGALMLENPASSTRPFYSMIEPGFWYYGLVVLATAATIIASQALITGAFSITHQAIRLGFFPRIEVIHTSADLEGRVYLPFMNLVLAVSCICLVLVFKRSSELAAAYGLAVSGTMFFTTLLFFAVVVYRWRIAFWKIFPLFLLLISIDLAFLVSNFSKIMDGGYLPIVIGAVFFLIMLVWKNGRLSLSKFYRERSKNLEEFIQDIESGSVRRVPGTLVALSSNENKVPPVLIRLVETTHAIHENILLLTVITPDEPQVQASERVKIYPVSDRIFRVIMKFGFMEKVDVPGTLASCQFEGIGKMNADQMIYVLGKETVVVRGKSRMDRLRQEFFSFLSRNASPASDAFNLPPRQVLELGSQMAL